MEGAVMMTISNVINGLTVFIAIFGTFISLAFVSNLKADKWLKNVNKLITNCEFENFNPKELSNMYLFIKRFCDITILFLTSSVFLPILLIFIILIKIQTHESAFIKIESIGKGRKQFYKYRFRTRVSEINTNESSEQEFTKIGSFLHKTSIEYLPVMINVLRGEMSLIGVSQYSKASYEDLPESIRIYVSKLKPGVASLWTVSWDKHKFNFKTRPFFDLYYLNKSSLFLDLLIAFKCVGLAFAKTSTL
jgi:O-antigen biosynthesis protein WbqP